MKRHVASRISLSVFAATALWSVNQAAVAADYNVDPGHSFIEFRIQHLGYSWLYGRFNTIKGEFSHDPANPGAATINLQIDPASVDTNHAERDKHIRSGDFLDVGKFPEASFKSTKYSGDENGGTLDGMLTVKGVTKPVSMKVKKLGEGPDPWGGYRAGFVGTMTLDRTVFGVDYNLGPASNTMEMELGIEGIKKK